MIWSRKIYLTVHTRLSIASKETGIHVVLLRKFNHEISVLSYEIFRALRSSLVESNESSVTNLGNWVLVIYPNLFERIDG